MEANTKGGAAFPSSNGVTIGDICTGGHAGMTLRDYMAAKVMPQVYAGSIDEFVKSRMGADEYAKTIAQAAYGIADAMLAERAK